MANKEAATTGFMLNLSVRLSDAAVKMLENSLSSALHQVCTLISLISFFKARFSILDT